MSLWPGWRRTGEIQQHCLFLMCYFLLWPRFVLQKQDLTRRHKSKIACFSDLGRLGDFERTLPCANKDGRLILSPHKDSSCRNKQAWVRFGESLWKVQSKMKCSRTTSKVLSWKNGDDWKQMRSGRSLGEPKGQKGVCVKPHWGFLWQRKNRPKMQSCRGQERLVNTRVP